MPHIDYYKGLNSDDKFRVEMDIEELAEKVCSMNYGAHRMVSAIVHALRAKNAKFYSDNPKYTFEPSRLAEALDEALSTGATL